MAPFDSSLASLDRFALTSSTVHISEIKVGGDSLLGFGRLLLDHLLLDLLLELLATLALDQQFRYTATLFLFRFILTYSSANDVGAAVDGLVSVARVSVDELQTHDTHGQVRLTSSGAPLSRSWPAR